MASNQPLVIPLEFQTLPEPAPENLTESVCEHIAELAIESEERQDEILTELDTCQNQLESLSTETKTTLIEVLVIAKQLLTEIQNQRLEIRNLKQLTVSPPSTPLNTPVQPLEENPTPEPEPEPLPASEPADVEDHPAPKTSRERKGILVL